MELFQAQLASDLNSNCRLVLMNEVLKSRWMIECNGKLLSEMSDTGDARTVSEVDNSSPEHEPSYSQNPDVRHEASSITLSRKNATAKQQYIAEFDTRSRSSQSFEREKASEVVSAVAPRGPYQRPARMIKPPDWLPDGWTAEIRTREMGNTAGTKDKYYADPTTGRRFRSKNEVMEYLQTGNLSRWKRRAKPAELNCCSGTASFAQIECQSPKTWFTSANTYFPNYCFPPKQVTAPSQKLSIPPFSWGPLQATNNYVNVDSYPHKADNPEKIYSASSWQSTNQQNVLISGYERSHIPWLPNKGDFVPQVTLRPRPVEIIDLESIPDATLSIKTTPITENPAQLISPVEFSMPFAGSKEQEAKDFSPQMRSSNKDMQLISKQEQLHLGVHNILREGNANSMVESCQVSKLSVLYGSNSSHGDPLIATSTSASNVGTPHSNVAGESSGGCKETAVFDNNRFSSVPQICPFPVLGSPLVAGTPLLWHYQMHLPSFTKSQALQHPVSSLHEKGPKSCGQVQLHNVSQLLFEKDIITRNSLGKEPRTTPFRVKKLRKYERHQEKQQLELLGKKLCCQGIALMRKELPK